MLRAGLIGSVTTFDVAAPTSTATDTFPALETKLGGTVAVNRVASTKVVASVVLFHCTSAPDAKPVPFTVRVNCGPPAVTRLGVSDVIIGRSLIVNGNDLDRRLPETTVTAAVPAVAIRFAGTSADI